MMLLSPEPRFEATARRGDGLRMESDQVRATRTMASSVSDQKSASGDFFSDPVQTSWELPPAAQDLCREKALGSTTTASGVLVLRNRYYDPNLGRFLSLDAHPGYAMKPQTLNPYVYCNNDPVNYWDPLGLMGTGMGQFFLRDSDGIVRTVGFNQMSPEFQQGYNDSFVTSLVATVGVTASAAVLAFAPEILSYILQNQLQNVAAVALDETGVLAVTTAGTAIKLYHGGKLVDGAFDGARPIFLTSSEALAKSHAKGKGGSVQTFEVSKKALNDLSDELPFPAEFIDSYNGVQGQSWKLPKWLANAINSCKK